MDAEAKRKRRTQKDKRDFVTFALDHVKHSTVRRQSKEDGMKRNATKNPHKEIGPLKNGILPVKQSPTIPLQEDS